MAENNFSQEVQDSVSSLYIAFFGRAPDADGFNYWCRELSPPTNASPFKIAADFALSPEWQNSYGSLTDPAAQVNLFYQNTFGRDADVDGLAYWVAEIDGGLAFSAVAYQIIWAAYLGGPNVDPNDNAIVNNKIVVSEYFAVDLASNDTVVAKTAFFEVTTNPSSVVTAEERLAEEVVTKTVNVTVVQAETLPSDYTYNLYDSAANLAAAPPSVLNGALSATIVGGGTVEASTLTYLSEEVPGTLNASSVTAITGTAAAIVGLSSLSITAPTNFDSILSGVAAAAEISGIKGASGTGTINGAALTAINGTAAAVVLALAEMAVDPANFNSTLVGVAQAADITAIAAANGTGTINGAALVAINGSAPAVLQALAEMATAPANFSSTLTGVAQATDITALEAVNGTGTINGAALTAINGTAAAVVQALADLDTDPTSFTSTIDGSTASAGDLNTVLTFQPTAVNIEQVQTVNLGGSGESFDVGNFVYGATGFVLNGGAGNDIIFGGINNDTITGGTGDDVLEGSDGNDILVFANGSELAVNSFVSGGNGIDTVRIDSSANDIVFYTEDFAHLDTVEILDLTGTGRQVVELGEDTDLAFSTGMTIQTVATAASLDLRGIYGAVSVNATGTNNADTMEGSSANDTLIGGLGNDSLKGGLGADSMNAGAGTNKIIDAGVGGDNIIHDAAGSTVAIALTGASAVTLTATELGATVTATAGGNRTINASSSNITGAVVIDGAALDVGESGIYTGGAGADTIIGGAGADTITSGEGNDLLTGGTGVDTFNVNGGINNITDLGVGGEDTLVVSAGAVADATVGNDYTANAATMNTGGTASLTSNNFDVNLSLVTAGDTGFSIDAAASTGSVLLRGSAFSDTITGGGSNDTLTGGLGVDTFNVVAANDLITDLGVGGQDVLVVSASAIASVTVGADYVATAATMNNGGTASLTSNNFDVDLSLVTAGNTGFTVTAAASTENLILKGSSWSDTITSGSGNDTISGGTGADSINAGGGLNFILDAGDGNDVISHNTAASNVVIAVTGTDSVTLTATQSGALVTAIVGGNRSVNASSSDAFGGVAIDGSALTAGQVGTYIGGAGADTILGGAGNDTITGGGRADQINAGAGDNFITDAGDDQDVVTHNSASSTVAVAVTGTSIVTVVATQLGVTATVTAGGSRVINASSSDASGAVVIDGTALTSVQSGYYFGGAGADTISGGAGADSINAGAGADAILGGAGNDTISGGAGADSINAGAGNNFISDAGNGADVIIHNAGSSTVAISVAGTDIVTLTAAVQGATATAVVGGHRTIDASTSDTEGGAVVINGAALIAGQNGLYTGGAGADTISGGAGNDTITGGARIDSINAGAGANIITDAGNGADVITHNSVSSTVAIAVTGTDTVTLTATQLGAIATATVGGNRTISASNSDAVGAVVIDGAALVSGQRGNFSGGAGADTISGGAGNDTIFGGAGNDVITGGVGNDFLSGGDGNDTLIFATSAELAEDGYVTGGAGTDTIRFNSGAVDVILENSDFMNVLSFNNLELAGTGRQSVALGQHSSNTFLNGITITTEATARSLNLKGALSTVSINATGTDNADTITGGSANDSLAGGAGNDTITGGVGADSLIGNSGNDTFNFVSSLELSADVTVAGGADVDTIKMNSDASALVLIDTDFTNVINVENLVLSGTGTQSVTLGNETNAAYFSGITITTNASAASLVLQGAASAVSINVMGTASSDSLVGGAANDTLVGGAGNDLITGGIGNDVITGDAGNDTITGGDGADMMNAGAGNNLVTDAGNGDDVIIHDSAASTVLVEVANNNSVTLTATQEGAFVTTATGLQAVVNASTSTAAVSMVKTGTARVNFTGGSAADTISGGSGNDNLSGNNGADTITGGEGNDTITGGAGTDILTGGEGVDTFIVDLDADVITDLGRGGSDRLLISEGASVNATIYTNFIAGSGTVNSGTNTFDNAVITTSGFSVDLSRASVSDGVTTTQGFTITNIGVATTLIGSNAADSITGAEGNDSLQGAGGADTITGSAGDDSIDGGSGNDILTGGDGNDVISGDEGADLMTGGAGNDQFGTRENFGAGNSSLQATAVSLTATIAVGDSFTFGNGLDVILDFTVADDTLDVRIENELGTYIVGTDVTVLMTSDVTYYVYGSFDEQTKTFSFASEFNAETSNDLLVAVGGEYETTYVAAATGYAVLVDLTESLAAANFV